MILGYMAMFNQDIYALFSSRAQFLVFTLSYSAGVSLNFAFILKKSLLAWRYALLQLKTVFLWPDLLLFIQMSCCQVWALLLALRLFLCVTETSLRFFLCLLSDCCGKSLANRSPDMMLMSLPPSGGFHYTSHHPRHLRWMSYSSFLFFFYF